MPGGNRKSQYPKEIQIVKSAVPVFTSGGDPALRFASTNCEIARITFYNSTSAAIQVNVMDGSGAVVNGFSAYSVLNNSPSTATFQFQDYLRCANGLVLGAISANLYVSIHGWAHMGQVAASGPPL